MTIEEKKQIVFNTVYTNNIT